MNDSNSLLAPIYALIQILNTAESIVTGINILIMKNLSHKHCLDLEMINYRYFFRNMSFARQISIESNVKIFDLKGIHNRKRNIKEKSPQFSSTSVKPNLNSYFNKTDIDDVSN